MVTARAFVYGKLQDPSITALLAGGASDPAIFAKKTMTSSVENTPYIVYKMGNDTSEEFSEDREISRQFWQVWVHDFSDGDTADYEKIDTIITAIKKVFKVASGDGVWAVRFLETSQDLDDNTLNTVFRYVRFQVIREDK